MLLGNSRFPAASSCSQSGLVSGRKPSWNFLAALGFMQAKPGHVVRVRTLDIKTRSQQPEAARLGDGRRAGRHIELGERIGDVPVDRVFADEEPSRNRLIVEAG
jgi:hypothetical protein